MGSQEYLDGLWGRPSSGWSNDYQRGQDDRRAQESASQQRGSSSGKPFGSSSGPSLPGTSGGLGAGILFLVGAALFVLLIPSLPSLAFLAIASLVSALLAGAWIVSFATRTLGRSPGIGYRRAARTAFHGLWQYLALTVVMTFAVAFFRGSASSTTVGPVVNGLWQAGLQGVRYFSAWNDVLLFVTRPMDHWVPLAGNLIVIRAPGLLAFAIQLKRRIGGPYDGLPGLGRALLVALVTVEVSLSIGLWICRALWSRAAVMPFTGDERLSFLVVYLGVLVLPCALVGALPGGAILVALTRLVGAKERSSFRDGYATALRALLAFGALSVLAVVLFRDADPIVWRIVEMAFGRRHEPGYSAGMMRQALLPLLAFQVPGLLWAAAIVARLEPDAYAGGRGYLKACAVAAVTCAAVFVPSWTAALRALPTVLVWTNSIPTR